MSRGRMSGSAVISARGLIRIYPGRATNVAALRGLDLEVAEGELLAVVGASGSGKSTLVRILAGLDRPSAGSLTILGRSFERASEGDLAAHRQAAVGVVEQHYWRSLSPYRTARSAIELPLELRGWRVADREARATDLLAKVGLAGRGEAFPAELSGGEQQRIAVAAALAPRPRLLLADEPTAELDERTAGEILELLRDLVRDEGATAVVVTHDRLVEAMADRIVYVRDGRAVAERSGGSGTEPLTLVDATGWLAPALPPSPAELPRVEPASGTVPAVVVHDLTRTYGQGRGAIDAVRDLDATFASGGLHIVTGPSGSGKSTLLRLIAGLDLPTGGVVETLGVGLGGLDREALARFRGRHVAICPQAPRLVPFLTVLENVELGLAIRGAIPDEGQRRLRALEALGEVGLGALAEAEPETLSGGERARVAIARAIAPRPDLLLLDEPTAALDRASAASLIRLLASLDRAEVTMIVATHDRDLVAAASDRLDLRDVRRGQEAPDGAPGSAPN